MQREAFKDGGTEIPAHLPEHLSICFWAWIWLVAGGRGEAYEDLDKAVRETKERGFNCLRVETGPLIAHDLAGRPRGPVRFRSWIDDNLDCALHGGAARGYLAVDVLERVVELFRAADKHDVTVICTTWLYQDTFCQLEDAGLRAEILSVPYADRAMVLARQHDYLLAVLKARGLAHRVAFVELFNEQEFTPVFVPKAGPVPEPTFDHWASWTWPDYSDFARTLAACDEAVAFLRKRHPEFLVTLDYGSPGLLPYYSTAETPKEEFWGAASQLVDFHYYLPLLHKLFEMALTGWPVDEEVDVERYPDLKQFLKADPCPFLPFREKLMHLRNCGPFWHRSSWFYYNLDIEVFDRWYTEQAARQHEDFVAKAEARMNPARDFARRHGLPIVLDEGSAFYPPFRSRIYSDPVGQRHEEIPANIGIRDGYWGIMPTGYVRPDTLDWNEPAVKSWLRGLNGRITRKGGG